MLRAHPKSGCQFENVHILHPHARNFAFWRSLATPTLSGIFHSKTDPL